MAKAQQYSTLSFVDTNKITPLVKNISDIGIDFSIIAKKNSRTIEEDEEDLFVFLSENDYLFRDDYKPYSDMSFESKVKYLWNFASNNEIEFILNTVCDNFINYDEYGYFCELTTKDAMLSDETKNKIQQNFKRIHSLYEFDNGEKGWELALEWLIEGYKTFEIIYQYKRRSEIEQELLDAKKRVSELELQSVNESITDKAEKATINEALKSLKSSVATYESRLAYAADIAFKNGAVTNSLLTSFGKTKAEFEEEFDFDKDDLVPVSIIGFQPVASHKAVPMEYLDKEKGKKIKIWKVLQENGKYVVLSDNQIVQIEYSKVAGSAKKISYIERLMRNFNLTRKLEESRVAWNILNSQFRLKMVVPLGNKVSAKAKQALKNFTDKYKEELFINDQSGEVTVNGTARINYSKNIALPNRGGNSPEIDGIAYQGPDLSNMDVVEYFRSNMWRDSFVPSNRFDRSGNVGALSLFRAEGVPYDEISYHKFLKRMKTQYEVLIKKPVYIQTLLDFPDLKIDNSFKNKIGFKFFTDSYYEEAKQAEIDTAKMNIVSSLENATGDDGKPLFTKKYLYVTKSKLLSEDDWRNIESEKAAMNKINDGGQGGDAGGAGGDAGFSFQ